MVKVKICGIQNPEDALLASELGAHCIGMVFSDSKRRISKGQGKKIVEHLPIFTITAGVFVNESLTFIKQVSEGLNLDIVQLHGDESPEFFNAVKRETQARVIKVVRVKSEESLKEMEDYSCDTFLLDAYSRHSRGGSGKQFDLDLFPKTHKMGCLRQTRYILAGGLTPENVKEAVIKTEPYAVCVSSGVEIKGRKSYDKMKKFIYQVQEGSETSV